MQAIHDAVRRHSTKRRTSRFMRFRRCSIATSPRISSGESSTAIWLLPFAVPAAPYAAGACSRSTPCCSTREQLLIIFSFSHSYFLVDMEVPSAYVRVPRASIMPGKPKAEIYTSVGLQKQGKNLFYRDLLHHLSHSSDQFIIAPGIKGLVMLVFTLPSFPYVFKLIKDNFPPPKETTRAKIQEKYQLVKRHDRLGRMADTLEYSSVALPVSRLDEALMPRAGEGSAVAARIRRRQSW